VTVAPDPKKPHGEARPDDDVVVWKWKGTGWTIPWVVKTSEEEQKLRRWLREGQWIARDAAIELIQNHCKTTVGHAQKLLLDARPEVRYANDIDRENPRFDYAYAKDDLEGWLDRHYPPQPEPELEHEPPSKHEARRRGPKPKKFDRVVTGMQTEIKEGNMTLDELKGFDEEALAARYKVSRKTARKARDRVEADPITVPNCSYFS
jgi:hypothetical protein